MATIKGPKDHADLHEYFSSLIDVLKSEQNYVEIVMALKTMMDIENKTRPHGFCSDDTYQVYHEEYVKLQMIFLFKGNMAGRIDLFHKAVNFIKSTNIIVSKEVLLSMYVFHFVCPLLKLGNKIEAKKGLLECKKIFDEIDMHSLSVEEQFEAKFSLYSAYFDYYKHPLALNGTKMIYNGVFVLKTALKGNVGTSTTIIGKIYEVIDETIKVRAFRQSNYLLRAVKVFYKSNKNDPKTTVVDDFIKSGKMAPFQCNVQLLYAKHMLKILMTMKETAIAEDKISQGLSLSKNEKSCFKIIEDCYTFDDVEVPEEDEILNGLLKNEEEIKLIYRQIQKRMKSVKALNDENIKKARDQCLAELKDVEKFFKLKN